MPRQHNGRAALCRKTTGKTGAPVSTGSAALSIRPGGIAFDAPSVANLLIYLMFLVLSPLVKSLIRASESATMPAPCLPSSSTRCRTHFGTVIFELRVARGLTQRQLGRLTGLQPSAICDMENLRRPPPREEQVAALSRALTSGEQQDQLLHDLARVERRATAGLRISRHTPRRVAQLLRDIALRGEHLSDRQVTALRAQLQEILEPQ